MTADTGWNSTIASLPSPHLLQTEEWGRVKSRVGWEPFYHTWKVGGALSAAMVLQRSTAFPLLPAHLRILYVSKGPLLNWADSTLRAETLDGLASLARRKRAVFIKIDPDVKVGSGIPGEPGALEDPLGLEVSSELSRRGWIFSREQVQFRNTVLVDLNPTEDELLARMKQKTRYNIRLAQRKGVIVRVGAPADFDLLYQMYAETSIRDGFVIRHRGYYLDVWQTFWEAGMVEPLIAEVGGEPAAAVFIFRFASRAWYLHGMSRPLHREKMPNYLLQWEAMRRAKAAGCYEYDLWGAPDQFTPDDPLWGVYRFKEGLGGQTVRTIGAWDLPVRPFLYQLYTQTLPRVLEIWRRRGRAQTRQSLPG